MSFRPHDSESEKRAIEIRYKKVKEKMLKNRTITSSGCWEYNGALSSEGYHRISVSEPYSRKDWYVHVLAMKIFKPQEYNELLWVLHRCNNRRCFNPEHLYTGTPLENTIDSIKAGTHYNYSKSKCDYSHDFTPENTHYQAGSKARRCLTCLINQGRIRKTCPSTRFFSIEETRQSRSQPKM
jgi:hypothetical protein